jgi:glucosamine kinase
MNYYIGIDSGGTNTRCVVGNGAQVLGVGRAAGSNIVRLGADAARTAIHTALAIAYEEARVSPRDITRTCIGAAGISAAGVSEALREIVNTVVSGSVDVVGDHEIAFQAAFSGTVGVIAISGTGSIAFGRNERGQEARAGGHGFAISDEGSAHWIGRMAVSKTLYAFDGGQATTLRQAITQKWNIDPNNLVQYANAVPPPDFATLCVPVIRAAEEGDPVAISVLRQAGAELARISSIVADRLWAKDETVSFAMAGGVFRNSVLVRDNFTAELRRLRPLSQVSETVAEPALGALFIAIHR